jgi:PD-(D/E)XK nuclease superfamily
MIGPLHVSELRTYLRCPRKWSHAYRARRVPIIRPEALLRGSAVHRWLNAWHSGEIVKLPLADRAAFLPADPIARACCLGYEARYGLRGIMDPLVEVPFRTMLGRTEVAGNVDVTGFEPTKKDSKSGYSWVAGDPILIEHKTTSADISPGSSYWQEIAVSDSQISMYSAAFPGAKILYDAIRKPGLRKLRAGKPNEETDGELVARCLDAMAKEPEKYFQRAVMVRLEHEHAAFVRDVELVDELRRRPEHPRNASSCHSFGRRCGFFGVCWQGQSLDDDSVFTHNDHGEHASEGETE